MSHLNRRDFFEQSLFAAAAAAVTVGADEWVSAADAVVTGPNDTIRHAIIGCRIRGRAHAQEFTKIPGVDVNYVCDPDQELANEHAEQVEKLQGRRPKVVRDMREIFDDPAIDTVSVAAPNHWHALAAIWAMQAGKDVFVEKPVSHNLVEGRRTVQVARKTQRICQAGTQNRSSGPLTGAAEFIRAGNLGEISLARTVIYGRRGSIGAAGKCEIPAHVDFNLWLGPATDEQPTRPQLHYDWHWVWDTGNGELGNNNIHMIDITRWLLGLEGLGDSVLSVGGRLGYEDAGETPNTQMVVHRFGPTTVIQEVRGLKSEPFAKPAKSGYVIYGSQGIVADGSLFTPEGELVRKFTGVGENHFANFIKAVRSRQREDLRADILEGHISTGLCHVGNISHRLGQPQPVEEIAKVLDAPSFNPAVRETFDGMVDHLRENEVDLRRTPLTLGPSLAIDSDAEKFVAAPAADALLGREYRRPFVVPSEQEI